MLEDTAILIMEDSEDHFQLIKNNLLPTHTDSDIIQFKNGRDVLDFFFKANGEVCFEDRKKYILMLDISTSQVNGIEVLKKIKRDVQTKKIPVIILTETDDPDTVEQCYSFGCSTYIVKPEEYQDFEETIQKVGHFLSVVETTLIQ
ncbi:MAG: response regulator [Planctomycetota bacterium]